MTIPYHVTKSRVDNDYLASLDWVHLNAYVSFNWLGTIVANSFLCY